MKLSNWVVVLLLLRCCCFVGSAPTATTSSTPSEITSSSSLENPATDSESSETSKPTALTSPSTDGTETTSLPVTRQLDESAGDDVFDLKSSITHAKQMLMDAISEIKQLQNEDLLLVERLEEAVNACITLEVAGEDNPRLQELQSTLSDLLTCSICLEKFTDDSTVRKEDKKN